MGLYTYDHLQRALLCPAPAAVPHLPCADKSVDWSGKDGWLATISALRSAMLIEARSGVEKEKACAPSATGKGPKLIQLGLSISRAGLLLQCPRKHMH